MLCEEWVFPTPTRTGHIEKSSLGKQYRKAVAFSKLKPFLTCWAANMDP